ncbi:MAG: hypothetical protein HY744_00750 [Deltaproteobacteria bacterium]|nr:hypothetical protein [Deltaproteobacteria bacterium]
MRFGERQRGSGGRGARWIGLAGTAVLVAGCGEPTAVPPSAVIVAEPTTVCVNDGFQTEIALDGSQSAARISLVPSPPADGGPQLSYAWSFTGAAYLLEDGELGDPQLSVTTAGDRPLHVRLTTRNAAGGEASSLVTISISVPAIAACRQGACPPGMSCVARAAGELCVPDAACTYNADCPICFACDVVLGRCVPREGLP